MTFELIPTVKMENRHPLEGSFDNESPTICNHCGVIAAGILKTPKRRKVNPVFGRS